MYTVNQQPLTENFRIDLPLLIKQKNTLVDIISRLVTKNEIKTTKKLIENLDGILNLLDTVQDTLADYSEITLYINKEEK